MTQAFEGVRVLDFTQGVAGPLASMLLADLGADVIKLEGPAGDVLGDHPGYLCWNRNKRRSRLDLDRAGDRRRALELLATADVAVFDHAPGELERLGLDAPTLAAEHPRLLHGWLPAHAARGPGSDLPADHGLLGAQSGVGFMQFSWEETPVHLVTPQLSYAQGLLGAVALAAGLYERARSGLGQSLVVSGLDAVGAVQSGGLSNLGRAPRPPNRGARGTIPNYKLYCCKDGQWLFLATLLPAHFLLGLETIGLSDVLEMEGVDGQFENILKPGIAGRVRGRMEARFAERSRADWLDTLRAAGVPAGPVEDRAHWFASETVASNDMRVELEHPKHGSVSMPGVPVRLWDTPGEVRHLPEDAQLDTLGWNGGGAAVGEGAVSGEPGAGPLAGARILDLGVIIAGPFASAVLANFGADVIKVEPLSGDTFRTYGAGFVGWNQGKRSVSLDLKDPRSRDAFFEIVRSSDVVCDNYRHGVLERLGIDWDTLSKVNERLVQASVTAYGSRGLLSADPGFDPLMQARSGMMAGQGGSDEPVFHQIAVNDTASALATAFGVASALYAREHTGRGQRIETSLASQSVLCQSGELVTYRGRPAPFAGGRDCVGVRAVERFYECEGGWLFVSCSTDAQARALVDVLGVAAEAGSDVLAAERDGSLAQSLGRACSTRDRDSLIGELRAVGVPAAPAVTPEGMLDSELLATNRFFERTDHPSFGELTTVRAYASFSRTPARFVRRAPLLGEHTREVLRDVGLESADVSSLVSGGLARELDPPLP